MDCKRALEAAGGDLQKAEAVLREKGLAKATLKAGRSTGEGLVDAYIHAGNRMGALVELNCETDFTARTPEFRELAHQLAMQVAAMAPVYVDEEEMPADEARSPQEVCLLQQPFIKDPSQTVKELVLELMARVGENIRVRQMARFSLGE